MSKQGSEEQMTTLYRGKSIKELVNSRIIGKIYRRQPTIVDPSNSKPTLQDVAESVFLKHDREADAEKIYMNKSQKIQELNSAIVNNSVHNHNPVLNKIHTPTILQKLSPTRDMRKGAYVAVAEAQTMVAKESVGVVEMKQVQAKQTAATRGFGRVPKFLSNY